VLRVLGGETGYNTSLCIKKGGVRRNKGHRLL
jgi:hypothetical protein